MAATTTAAEAADDSLVASDGATTGLGEATEAASTVAAEAMTKALARGVCSMLRRTNANHCKTNWKAP